MAFIDLGKSFDRVPRDLIWQALRSQLVTELMVMVIQDLYQSITAAVRCAIGLEQSFEEKVIVCHDSALSSILFNLYVHYATVEIQQPIPWTILYVDDMWMTV